METILSVLTNNPLNKIIRKHHFTNCFYAGYIQLKQSFDTPEAHSAKVKLKRCLAEIRDRKDNNLLKLYDKNRATSFWKS